MKKEELTLFCNKKIRIVLKNDFTYIGEIKILNEDSIIFLDKFKKIILIPNDEIKIIYSEDEHG